MDRSAGSPDPFEGDDAPRDEDGPFYAWLPPEDRLWRHPSESTKDPEGTGAPGNAERAATAGLVGSLGRRRGGRTGPRSVLVVAVVAGLVGASAATGIGMASGLWPHDTTVVRSVQPSTSAVSLAAVGSEPTNWTAVDDSVAASVVTVSVDGSAGPQVGSGLVFLQSGAGSAYIVTDRSLFARDRAMGYIGTIDVTFLAGSTARARLVGDDRFSGLAVLSIPGASQAVPAALGTVTNLREAEQVLVVGSRNAPSVSIGSISSEDRTVALADGSDVDSLLAVAMPALGSSASGGPILNEFGQVLGITLSVEAADQADQQFTFAVPIDVVSRVATDLIDGAPVTHPWIGVSNAEDLPSAMAHQLGLDGGVQVGLVASGSPAALAGLHPDDIITALDGRPVVTTGALMAQITSATPGRTVPVTYVHAGRTLQGLIRVGDEPRDS